MSGRPILSLPLRQAARQLPVRARNIHNVSMRLPPRPQQALRRAPLQQFQQRRHAGSFIENAKNLTKQNPLSIALAVVVILAGAGSVVYANYVYQSYILAAFHKYPEPVAKKLRRALYYTNVDLQPKEALKYYKQALKEAEEIQMDPFSDEIIGVKIQVAKLLEDIQQWPKAIEVLERTRADNLAWLEQFGSLDHNKEHRTNVLAKTVGISVKLGELYGHPAVYDRDAAQERLVWAVEAVLKEQQRRINNKVKEEEEGAWMGNDQIGAALEALAHSYEAKSQHYLATPLFLQALSLYPAKDCHSVVLMNNLASSLAQQSPAAARAAQTYATSQNISERPTGPPASRESMIENAKQWAQKALDVAAGIAAPERNQECDIGCAVATHNLGEFAEMSSDISLARKKYQEAVSLSRAIGFEEGVEMSSARLRELAKAG
ncbi:putative tetratricopeptide-like helical domain superfamily, protein Mrg3 [Septoria linicola]|nr:putative tetratricopeptide-like helical domain superfamily, protein Mrg3 [Septoria linicola]